MKQTLPYFLFFSILLSFPVSADTGHQHSQIDIPSSSPRPEISIHASRDAVAGWNIHLVLKHFIFTPEKVNQAPVVGEGHAHLYLNGKKIARLYDEWYHLPELARGKHIISVTLNANNHAEFSVEGRTISATTTITND